MDFGGGGRGRNNHSPPGVSKSEQTSTNSKIDIMWSLVTMVAGGALAYPLESIKVNAILHTSRPNLYTPKILYAGLPWHLARLGIAELLASLTGDGAEASFQLGLNYPGFYRRLLTEHIPLFIAFMITMPLELKKQQQLTGVEVTDASRFRMSKRMSNLGLFNASVFTGFFAVEKALSEQIRRYLYRNNQKSTYLTYDRRNLVEKAITVPAASVAMYPFELFRVFLNQTYLNQPAKIPRITILRDLMILKSQFSNLLSSSKPVPLSLLTYTAYNYVICCVYLKYNSQSRRTN